MTSDNIIDDLLHEQESRFCTYANANIFVTTFNVNGKTPPRFLGKWLQFDTANLPDFVAIGLQEMDLSLDTYVTNNALKQQAWLFSLQHALPNVYTQVECVRLIGIFLVLYKNSMSRFKISNVCTAIVPTGFLKFGNKGGVGISLEINDSVLCFINSHLAAGSNELARRNQDYRDISQMQFSNSKTIYDHEVVIWLGDLNYRLTSPLSFEDVVRVCRMGNHKELFQFDQLREQQKAQTAFNGFRELTPDFKPTYKYDVGTNEWDTSEKRRVPAWCDRILWWVRDKNVRIEQLIYWSCDNVTLSDHKPVCSTFSLGVKHVDIKKRQRIYEELLREGDRHANNLLPQVSVSTNEMHFGTIYFNNAQTANLTIRNTGATSTRFNFATQHPANKPEAISEDWLTVTPKSSFLEVGSEKLVTLQACVKNEEAAKISEETQLTCFLVLRLDQGRHYFIVVNAIYEPPLLTTNDNGNDRNPESTVNSHEDNEQWLIDFGDSSGPSAK